MAYCNNLNEALLSRNVDMIRHYLDTGILEQTDNKRWEILLEAIKSGCEDILEVVSAKINITMCDNRNVTALHLAACCCRGNIVDYLLRLQKFDVNATDAYGMTALHYACYWGCSDIAWKLLQAGADFRIVNKAGNTPGKLADIRGYEKLAQQMSAYENYYNEVMQSQQSLIAEEEMVLSRQPESPIDKSVDVASLSLTTVLLECNDHAAVEGQLSSIKESCEIQTWCHNKEEKCIDINEFSSTETQLKNLKLMSAEQMRMLNDIQAQIKDKQYCTFYQKSDGNMEKCRHKCCCSTTLIQLTEAQKYLSEIIKNHTVMLQQMYDLLVIEKAHKSTSCPETPDIQEVPMTQQIKVRRERQKSGSQNPVASELLQVNESKIMAAVNTNQTMVTSPVLSQRLFCKLSKELGDNIYELGSQLNLDLGEIQTIYQKFGSNWTNFHFNILNCWWQKQGGNKYTPCIAYELADALRDIGREDLCRLVEVNTD